MISPKMIDGDISITEIVEGDDEIAQNIKLLLDQRVGEWFLDTEEGFRKDVLEKKRPDDREVTEAIQDCVLQEERIDFVSDIEFERDYKKRKMNISFVAIKKDGNKLEVSTVVDI